MFENIFSKSWGWSATTKAVVDGADVRYVVMFVSDGVACAVSCSVYAAGIGSAAQSFSACTYGDKIRSF